MLNGCQRHRPGNRTVPDSYARLITNQRSQFSNSLVFKYLFRSQLQTGLPRLTYHLQADDRIAPQLEEVILDPNFFHAQKPLPNLSESLLRFVARCDVCILKT